MLKKISAVGVSCVTALVLMLSVFASPASVDAVTLEAMTSQRLNVSSLMRVLIIRSIPTTAVQSVSESCNGMLTVHSL